MSYEQQYDILAFLNGETVATRVGHGSDEDLNGKTVIGFSLYQSTWPSGQVFFVRKNPNFKQ